MKSDNLEMEGTITQVLPRGFFEVTCDNGHKLNCRPCGKILRIRNLIIREGQQCKVMVSPYDLNNGLIRYVYRK
jgi:translation initiation factor IF-1